MGARQTVAEGANFPSENDVTKGRLLLSGADAMGPNPWSTPRPTAAAHGLTADDFDDVKLDEARVHSRREMRDYWARLLSAFIVPLSVVGVAYYVLVGIPKFDLQHLPQFEWVAYLGASLLLAAIAAYAQTRQYSAARELHHRLLTATDRRMEFQAADRKWLEDQRRRTTTAFWIHDIRRIASEKGMRPSDAFAQEVGKLFTAWGWMVKLNQRAQDYGVDIFANGKEGSAVVHCQHGTEAGPATAEIRDLAGSRHAFNADYGLLISIHPPSGSRTNEFFSDRGQLEFWHLGHILEQCLALYKQRTGEAPPSDDTRAHFLNPDGTPILWQSNERDAAE